MTRLWFNLMNGPLMVDHDRLAKLANDPTPQAIDLLRNFKALEDFKSFQHLENQIRNCLQPESVPPFMWYMADKDFPFYRSEFHTAMTRARYPLIDGTGCVLIDASKRMQEPLHPKLTRMEMAACYAVSMPTVPKDIYTVSDSLRQCHDAVGLGGVDRIMISQNAGGCNVERAITDIEKIKKYDFMLVFTDHKPDIKVDMHVHVITRPGRHVFHFPCLAQKKKTVH